MEIAIIKTGGKQYKVAAGKKLKIEKLVGEAGDSVNFDEVLLLADEQGVKIGQPKVEGAKVSAKILKQDRADKITVFKYKSKKRHHVKRGHRQPYSLVEIEKING